MKVNEINFGNEEFGMFVIDEMANKIEKKYGKGTVIRMTLGNSELTLNDKIIQRMIKSINSQEERTLVYPTGLPELKKKIKDYYDKYDIHINENNIIIGSGTSMIFRNLMYLLAEEGDEVLLPKPYYPLYKISAILAGATCKYYNVSEDGIDLKSLMDNFSNKTKVVVVNSPGNPLGNIITQDEFKQIDQIIGGQATIINDEIYTNVSFIEELQSSLKSKENCISDLVITSSFSKGFRMYSRRIGYCIVPDKLITPLSVIQQHTHLTSDPVSQFGAIEALNNLDDVKQLTEIYKKRRDYTIKKFIEFDKVSVINSNGGFYITINCENFMKDKFKCSLDLCKDILAKTGVAVVPGSDFGVENTIRLSFTTSLYNAGIDRLYEYFDK